MLSENALAIVRHWDWWEWLVLHAPIGFCRPGGHNILHLFQNCSHRCSTFWWICWIYRLEYAFAGFGLQPSRKHALVYICRALLKVWNANEGFTFHIQLFAMIYSFHVCLVCLHVEHACKVRPKCTFRNTAGAYKPTLDSFWPAYAQTFC